MVLSLERERERQRDTERDRETQRDTERHRERESKANFVTREIYILKSEFSLLTRMFTI